MAGDVRTTVDAGSPDARPRHGRVDRPPGILVVVAPETLRGSSRARRALLAGHASLPASEVDRAAEIGEPVVVGSPSRREEARDLAAVLGRDGIPADVIAGSGFLAPLVTIAATFAGALAAVLLLGALLVGATSLLVVGPLVLGALACLVALVAGATTWARRTSAERRALDVAARQDRLRWRGDDAVARAGARIAATRRRLGTADLPAPALDDLTDSLAAVEGRLEALARRAEIAETLPDPAEASEERARIAEAAGRIELALARAADGLVSEDDEAVAELVRTVRLVRAAASDADAPSARPPRLPEPP